MEKTANRTKELQEVINIVLDEAKQLGATAAQASAHLGSGFSVTVRMGEVETVQHNNDKGIEISVYVGKKTGSASTSDLSEKALRLTVEKACNIAKFTSEDPCTGLADKGFMAFNYSDLDLYHHWPITPEQGIDLALQCENLARAMDKRITNSEGASVHTHDYVTIYGNTHGFIGSYPSSSHGISCGLIAYDGHEMQRDHDYSVSRDHHDLADVSMVARRAAEQTVNRLGAQRLSTRQCPVIFSPETARGLIGHFIAAISGGNLYRNASFLLNHLGKQVFPEHVRIDERPHLLKGIGSAPFDHEGVATRAKDFVTDGILRSYSLGNYSASKLGMQTTGNSGGVHNVFINHSDLDLAGLLQRMGTGLLITELIGQGVNIVTGDYSRGAFGYWVENGQIQYPVQEITIAGNLRDMFLNLVAVANDVDHRGNIQTGSILLNQMTIAGV